MIQGPSGFGPWSPEAETAEPPRPPSTEYDVWWCPQHGEWKVRSRPHNPDCPTCGKGGWWRRFTTGPAYEAPPPGPIV